MTATTEVYPGILPERVENPPPVDPVLKGLRLMPHRVEIREILARHGTTWLEITETQKRYPAYRAARLEIATLLHGRGWSFTKIGRLMRRDHTTILYWMGRLNRSRG